MGKKSKIELIARITTPDGKVFETTAAAPDGVVDLDDFDLSTRDGFLRDFDALEQGLVAAGKKAEEDVARKYLEEASKKNSPDKKEKEPTD